MESFASPQPVLLHLKSYLSCFVIIMVVLAAKITCFKVVDNAGLVETAMRCAPGIITDDGTKFYQGWAVLHVQEDRTSLAACVASENPVMGPCGQNSRFRDYHGTSILIQEGTVSVQEARDATIKVLLIRAHIQSNILDGRWCTVMPPNGNA